MFDSGWFDSGWFDSGWIALPVLFAGAFGLLIGSFLNVVIYRLPRELSIVRPRSFCPGCEKQVRAWDNIPLLSYLFLLGKCRDCGVRISMRYPAVEALTGLLFAWFIATRGVTLLGLKDCIAAAIFLALAVTDLETLLLPEPLTIGGIAAGLLFSLCVPLDAGTAALLGFSGRAGSLLDSMIGAALPAFLLWSLGWLFEKIRHQEALGFGDVVMLAAVGAFFGLGGAFLTLVLAAVTGSIIGIGVILVKRANHRTYELPLGFFLGIAGIAVAAAGDRFNNWYASFFQ